MSKYPECDKLTSVSEDLDTIRHFLDTIPYSLATHENGYYLTHVNKSTDDILYDFFGIDRKKLDEERQQILLEAMGGL